MKLIDLTVRNFITQLANPTEGPGGGSASALIGLSGIALLQMVSGREASPVCQPELAALARQLTKLIDEDQQAFAAVIALQPQENEPNWSPDAAKFEQAVVYAIEVPLAIVKVCIAGLTITEQALTTVDRSMLSELIVAAEALQAGVASSVINMKVNLSLLQSAGTVATYTCFIEQYRKQGKQALSTIYQQAAIYELHASQDH